MFAVCLKYAKNQSDAEDILQDSFITIFEKIEQFKGKGSFEGWLKRIAINTAIQRYRGSTPLYPVREYDVPSEDVTFHSSEFPVELLLQLIQQLPHQYRLVFNLYALDNYSHKEIAEMLHISTGTSKSNLSRARMILRNQIVAYKKQRDE